MENIKAIINNHLSWSAQYERMQEQMNNMIAKLTEIGITATGNNHI